MNTRIKFGQSPILISSRYITTNSLWHYLLNPSFLFTIDREEPQKGGRKLQIVRLYFYNTTSLLLIVADLVSVISGTHCNRPAMQRLLLSKAKID